MNAVDVLEMAKERLRGHWCQGDYAMTDDGESCPTKTPGCRVCAHGAVISIDIPDWRHVKSSVYALLDTAAEQASNGVHPSAPSYNDAEGRTEEEVLALFDKAIELAKAEEVSAK